MLAQFRAILLSYEHMSVQEFLPWCSSYMSEVEWNWNGAEISRRFILISATCCVSFADSDLDNLTVFVRFI